jgi:4-alpha-glucanotransferase
VQQAFTLRYSGTQLAGDSTHSRRITEDGAVTDQQLRRLAEAHRVAVTYVDWRKERVAISPDTLRAVLTALGVDASSDAAVRDSLRAVAQRAAAPGLPPVSVVRHGAPMPVAAEIEGFGRVEAGQPLPPDLPLGWYRLRRVDGATGELAYVPDRLALPRRRLAGLMSQLYSVRSGASWGFGDLGDLAELTRWSGRLGAGFTLVNPLHAAEPVPPVSASPYLPVSRRFASPLYLRIEQIPEYAQLPTPERERLTGLAASLRTDQRSAAVIDRDRVWQAKREALGALFAVPLSPGRREAYRRFVVREGQALTDFATWSALAEAYGPRWRDWPSSLRPVRSPQVAAEASRLADRVEFHRWLQWLLDEQLAAVQAAARDAGMPLGVLHDLAVGVDPDGADTWMHQDVYAYGVTVGVPPDAFNRLGQDWQQPPWHPGRLAAAGYGPYRDLLRFWLRHAGGLRADHVMGLFRLWWVPEGASPMDGTYVHYDHEAMVGILALEAHLAGAVVVGEDLGTVEPWVRDYLASRGVLGTSLLWFEADDSKPRPADRWRTGCLATVDSHDMPPIAGYATGEFIALREKLGLLGNQSPAAASEELAAHVTAWRRLLVSCGLLSTEDAPLPELTRALHLFLTRTPAVLVGLSLADLVGERRSQNLPGTHREYPNWQVPLCDGDGRGVLLEDLMARPEAAAQLSEVVVALAPDRGGAQPAGG